MMILYSDLILVMCYYHDQFLPYIVHYN